MAIIQSDTRFVQFIISITCKNLIPDRKLVIAESYQIENMIDVNSWKCWIMKQVMTKFGSLKIDNGGDTMMSSDAIYYSDAFRQLSLSLSSVDLYFVQLSYRFLYRQNKLESIRTVNIPNVTICCTIPSFQMLISIICPIYCDNVTTNCIQQSKQAHLID